MTSVDSGYKANKVANQTLSRESIGYILGDQQSDMIALQQTYQEQIEAEKGYAENGHGKPIVKLYRTIR